MADPFEIHPAQARFHANPQGVFRGGLIAGRRSGKTLAWARTAAQIAGGEARVEDFLDFARAAQAGGGIRPGPTWVVSSRVYREWVRLGCPPHLWADARACENGMGS